MASISYPHPDYNSGAITELEHERLVASQAPDGVLGAPTDLPVVYADGTGTRVVKLRANRRVLVRGALYDTGPSDVSLPSLASNSSGSTRVDLIVARLDRSDSHSVVEAAVTGTPGAGAPAPTYNTGSTGVWEFPLAVATVANGATTLAAGTVTPLHWYIGEDGQILCTPSTRPPHHPGRRIFEPATGIELLSDGLSWVTQREDTGWQNLTATAGLWTVFADVGMRYRRVDGSVTVTVGGTRAGGNLTPSTPSTLTTLPAGSRPSQPVSLTGYINGGYLVHGVINTTGTVQVIDYFQSGINTGQSVRFNSVTYPI